MSYPAALFYLFVCLFITLFVCLYNSVHPSSFFLYLYTYRCFYHFCLPVYHHLFTFYLSVTLYILGPPVSLFVYMSVFVYPSVYLRRQFTVHVTFLTVLLGSEEGVRHFCPRPIKLSCETRHLDTEIHLKVWTGFVSMYAIDEVVDILKRVSNQVNGIK